ncbi:hypothetical protein Tco_0418191 [Tanacetum coccineum]
MTSLADKSLLSGGDNKPPMLEKHLYDSWKSRMELYMMNRPHGRMILASVEKGPLVWPSITEDGVTRLKEYVELTPAEAIQADCDIKAINIILQGLPTEIYALVSQHRVAKDLWEKIKLLMQGTSLTKQERECKLYDEFDKFTYKKGETLHEYYLRGKRCEKNYLSVRRYVADPDNAYPKRSITKLILKGAVIFDVVSYQFRCALNYSKLVSLKLKVLSLTRVDWADCADSLDTEDLEPEIDAMIKEFLNPSRWKELSKKTSSKILQVEMDPVGKLQANC